VKIRVRDFAQRYRRIYPVAKDALIQPLSASINHPVKVDDVTEFEFAQRLIVDRDFEAPTS
jgi:hypothetical protein